MTNVVQEISEIFKQHVKQQDDAFLDQITSQVNSVQDIIDDQGMRSIKHIRRLLEIETRLGN